MDKNALWKWLTLILLVMWSVWMFTKYGLTLGIDLQGGHSFVLEVDEQRLIEKLQEEKGEAPSESDVKDALNDAQDRALEVIRSRIDQTGTREPIIYPEPESRRIVVQLPGLGPDDVVEVKNVLTKEALLEFRMVHKENTSLVNALWAKNAAPKGFEIVRDIPSDFGPVTRYRKIDGAGLTADEIRAMTRFERPSGAYEFLLTKDEIQSQIFYSPNFVNRRTELTGDEVKNARVDFDQFGAAEVSLTFNADGANKFGNLTQDYAPRSKGGRKNTSDVERQMAIVLDGTCYSAPTIKEPIWGGSASISGSFSLPEAQTLAIVLRAGALPAPLNVINELSVDPTLGKQSIKSSIYAMMYGGIAVIIFMLIYYMFAGLVVNLALLVDALLLPLGMLMAAGFLGLFVDLGPNKGGMGLPTLTLPGIAGLILTIGMAVDANALIFERIREEQRDGKRFSSAITAGYEKVFSTIFDANITTLIVAIILFANGSGPIRGFAVTLSAGIIVSMYTALVFTRMLFDLMAHRGGMKKLRMLSILKSTPNFDFLGKRRICAGISLLLIVGTSVLFYMRGSENFGVDLTSGRALTWSFSQTPTENEIRAALDGLDIKEPFIQVQREAATGAERVMIKVSALSSDDQAALDEAGASAKAALEKALAANEPRLLQDETVGPQVGGEMRRKGIIAMALALLGIVIYITLRFEFSFALGAIVALTHDVLLTIGIFTLLGRQINLPIIAALLTIVGYSANDTIVVFDRIREDLGLIKNKSRSAIANISINQTLSRTLLTSMTTLLTVVCLLIFGGAAINDFALALFIGILVGTYSSIFVATPTMLYIDKRSAESAAAE